MNGSNQANEANILSNFYPPAFRQLVPAFIINPFEIETYIHTYVQPFEESAAVTD